MTTMRGILQIGKTMVAAAVMVVAMTSCGAALAPALIGATSALASQGSQLFLAKQGSKAKQKDKQKGKQKGKQKEATQQPAAVGHQELSAEDSLRYQYFFLEAMRQQSAENYDAAYNLLEHCLDINPNAAEAWFYMSMYQSELNKDSLSRISLERAAELNPKNDAYAERLGQYFLTTKEYDNATAVYERLADKNHQRTDVLKILIQLYQQNKDYDGMLDALNRVETIEGQREEITLAKMRIYEMMGDKKSAWKTLKSLSDEHPSDVNYRVMMGNWLMQNDKQKEAYKLFTTALSEEPENAYAQSSMYDYYRVSNQDSLARQMMRNILLSPKATSQSKSVMMRQAIQENEQAGGDSTVILRLYDEMLSVNPKDSDMAEMKVAYMSLKQMPEDSINNAIRQLLAIAPENVGARSQMLGSYLRRQDWQGIADICHEGSLYNPEEMVFYYYEGLAYYQQERRTEALETFQRGVSQINQASNAELVADLYYFMGDLLHQKEHDEEAFAAYDSCLQWKPDHMACLNNYAYYLCLQGKDLPRAEEMSFKTVKAEPKNTNSLDTYAWILFNEERYAEAKIYIDQALTIELAKLDTLNADTVAADTVAVGDGKQEAEMAAGPDETDENSVESSDEDGDDDPLPSAVILEHGGDIYAMTGDTAKAVELWTLALQYTDERRAMIEEKLKKKKYVKL